MAEPAYGPSYGELKAQFESYRLATISIEASYKARIAQLEAALRKYGYHEPECDFLLNTLPCTCGYEVLRVTLETRAEPKGPQPLSAEDRATVEQYLKDVTCPVCFCPKHMHRPGCSEAKEETDG